MKGNVVLLLVVMTLVTGCCITTFVSVGNNTPTEMRAWSFSAPTETVGIRPGKTGTLRHMSGAIVVSNAVLGRLTFPDVVAPEVSSTECVSDRGVMHKRQTLYVCVTTNGVLHLAHPNAPATPAATQSGRYPLKAK